jgi:hypothetical protein
MLVRPIILTTHDEAETRHLANKVVDVELPPLPDPLPEEQLHQQFEAMRPQILGALLTLLVDTFDTAPPFLPNRKTKNQKLEETVTEFLKTNQGAWTGTATALITHLGLSISPETITHALKQMTTIQLTHPQRKTTNARST